MQRIVSSITAFLAVVLAFSGRVGFATDWKTSQPAEQGMDASLLAKMDAHVRAALPHVRTILIARHGYLVFERYYNGASRDELQNIQSMTKSVTSALVGIASRQGRLTLDQRVLDFFPEIKSPRDPRVKAITIRHLLTMSSGIREGPPGWDKNDDHPAVSALSQTLDSDPGAKFNYSGYANHILAAVLVRATHQDFMSYAETSLLRPLGVSKVVWYKDKSGLELGCGSSLWLARDFLRFGQLYLDEGSWQGTRLIPAKYIQESRTTHLSGEFFGAPVTYGLLWFTDTISGHATYHAKGTAVNTFL